MASAEAGASAAARATGVERFGTEDARKRLWETPARADEQHPTAERRDICRGGRRREGTVSELGNLFTFWRGTRDAYEDLDC